MRLGDWVRDLPDGIDTLLGRGAGTASGGQRHRLALARVVLGAQRVVVLDEPTAHLDVDTGNAVMRDLVEALPGRSIIVIGHADTGISFDSVLETAPGAPVIGA